MDINISKALLVHVALWLYATTACPAQQGLDTLSVRPKVGLVLSGGGARGVAHVGVIRLIEEMQLPIDYVVGTSMGAIIGGLYAIGYTADEMDSLIMIQDWKNLLSNDLPRRLQPYEQRMARKCYQMNIPYEKGVFTENSAYFRDAGIKVRRSSLQTFPKVLARPGLIDGHNLMDKFVQLTSSYGDSLSYDTLPRSFACVAVDLVTGKEVVLNHGNLAESLRASMSIPGVFYPVYKDNQVLVDGGVVNNYPVNVARAMGADFIIGVEVNSSRINASELQSFAAIFERLIGTLGTDLHEHNVSNTDIIIQPYVKRFPVMGFDMQNLRQLIDIGYNTAMQSKPQLDSLKRHMNEVVNLDLVPDTTLRSVREVMPDVDGKREYNAPINTTNQVSLGLRLDSEDAAMALLSISAKRLQLAGLRCNVTAQASIHPWISARLSYAKENFFQTNLAVRYGYAHVVSPYERRHNAAYYHFFGSDLYLSHLVSSDFDLRAGIRYDNFWPHGFTDYTSRQSYTALYALWKNDLYDTGYFPTQGYSYGIEVSYNIKDKGLRGTNFWALQGECSTVLPLGSNTALLASLYVRNLFGEGVPSVYANAIGGRLPHRYLRQQFPFFGFTGCKFVNPHLVLPGIGFRHRLFSDVYAMGFVNYAYSAETLSVSRGQGIWGIGLQMSYNTTIGPLSLCTHWNDLYHRFGAYFSFGFDF